MAASLSLVAAAAFSAWTFAGSMRRPERPTPPSRAPVEVPKEPISLVDVATLGSAATDIVLLEFADFECSYCARFAGDILPEIASRYVSTGLMRIGFRHLPLSAIHSRAQRAAETAECARRQGRFWDMHARLFADMKSLRDDQLFAKARDLELEMSLFTGCMGGPAAVSVAEDSKLAEALGVASTPVFFLGQIQPDGRLRVRSTILGARPLADFVSAIEEVIRESRAENYQSSKAPLSP